MKEIEAALFDIDGTLLNTREFVYQAYKHTFHLHGLPLWLLEEIEPIMATGMSLEKSYRFFSLSEDVSELCETHRSYQLEHLYLSVPFPNTVETLKILKNARIKTAAVTSRSRRTSINTLEISGIIGYFDAIISGEDVGNPKPHPEPLLKALKQLEVHPEKAVMIGDTEADIIAGKRGGIKTIGVSYGFCASIAKCSPDFIIDDIAFVIPLLL